MQEIIDLLQAFLKPVSISIILAAVVGGFFFGIFYNSRLNLPANFAYHKFVAGAAFIFFVFLFRTIQVAMEGTSPSTVGNPAGWVGIMFLWGIYCTFVYIGHKLGNRF